MRRVVTVLIVIAVLLIIFFAIGPFYILEEGEQSVVIRFGKIEHVATEAGLKFKTPVVDNVVKFSKRILSWDGDPQRIQTAENQFIWVDTTARWRIVDPRKFYSALTTYERAYSRLDDIINSSVRTVIASNSLREAVRNSNIINEIEHSTGIASSDLDADDASDLEELANLTRTSVKQEEISKGRRRLSDEIKKNVDGNITEFGIEIIDVVIRQIRYSDDLTESVYNRMIKDRNQIAEAYRSYGQGKKQEWLGRLENEQKSILSDAFKQSETIKGEADANATRIYTEAYDNAAEFYEFWRAIESYRSTIPKFEKTLTTDMEYFNYLYSPTGR